MMWLPPRGGRHQIHRMGGHRRQRQAASREVCKGEGCWEGRGGEGRGREGRGGQEIYKRTDFLIVSLIRRLSPHSSREYGDGPTVQYM